MFSTDFIFRQQENLVDNQKSQAGYRPLRNKILFYKAFHELKLFLIIGKVEISAKCLVVQ